MLKKCANPKCSTQFKYLREGRLFRLVFETPMQGTSSPGVRQVRRGERFWLCGDCSSKFTLVFDGTQGVKLSPWSEHHDRKDRCILILDMTDKAHGGSK